MLHLSPSCQYYLYAQATDMRKGFDSLCGIVSSALKMDALSGSIFIFINKRRNQLKLLLWEGDGFALYYKRLEKGTFEIPENTQNDSSSLAVSVRQLQFILQGVSLEKVQYRKRYNRVA
jgi:transposase